MFRDFSESPGGEQSKPQVLRPPVARFPQQRLGDSHGNGSSLRGALTLTSSHWTLGLALKPHILLTSLGSRPEGQTADPMSPLHQPAPCWAPAGVGTGKRWDKTCWLSSFVHLAPSESSVCGKDVVPECVCVHGHKSTQVTDSQARIWQVACSFSARQQSYLQNVPEGRLQSLQESEVTNGLPFRAH